ncbi:MAG: DNA polymerase III subunit delta' [Pyrinomonadaceae bacterium]
MFTKLIGNENVKLTLKRLIANGRVPNSLLFAGDEGVGKRQFAFELARAFICTDPANGEACGTCAACTRVDNFVIPEPTDKNKDEFKKVFFGGHSDVGKVVTYKRTILVDAIRDLERNANFRPYEAQARFFIIDDAEKMNDEASNALLKTLEEPPATTHIFLITSRPDSLLPTIRSRCQMIRFAPVATDDIEKFLIQDRAFSHNEAKLAARLSRGSIGRAVSINVDQFRTRRERMLGVINAAVDTGDLAALLRASEEMNDPKNKASFEDDIDILESLIHDVWTLGVGGDTTRLVNTDLTDDITRLAAAARNADLPAWLRSIETMRENFVVNINRKIAADALFVTMAGV